MDVVQNGKNAAQKALFSICVCLVLHSPHRNWCPFCLSDICFQMHKLVFHIRNVELRKTYSVGSKSLLSLARKLAISSETIEHVSLKLSKTPSLFTGNYSHIKWSLLLRNLSLKGKCIEVSTEEGTGGPCNKLHTRPHEETTPKTSPM